MVIDMITAVSIQAFRARTARHHPTKPRREGHVDPGAMAAAGGGRAAQRRAGGEARRAAEDTEQFEPAAIEGRAAQPGGEDEAQRPAPGSLGPEGRWPAAGPQPRCDSR